MAPPPDSEIPSSLRQMIESLKGICGECGVLVGDVQAHTRWHAGEDQGDARQAVLDFLSSVDPQQLEAAVLELLGDEDGSPITTTLAVLKQTVSAV